MVTPLDVVKCNMQASPGRFKNVFNGFAGIAKEEGMAALLKGWVPTALGYHAQGAVKFGFNEFFKDEYANMLGEEASVKYRAFVWAGASATAEFFADIALCPFEMIKVKVQTSDAGTFPTEFGAAFKEMSGNAREYGWPLGSLVPLWTRQIPYTVVKFVGFEAFVEAF
jgi:solute carrier family 25 phosphate transporter 3